MGAPREPDRAARTGAGRWASESVLVALGNRRAAEEIEPLAIDPEPTARLRFRRAVAVPVLAGIAVFVLGVIVTIGGVALRLGSSEFETPAPASDGVAEATAPGPDGAQEPTPGAPETVFVHVIGEVAAPGVVEVPAGTRVSDAIDAAGGATESAVLDAINLAREVTDGEQILVPDHESAAQAFASAPVSDPAGGSPGNGALVNVNTADAAELETLPGVGPALAGRILDWREQNGPFADVEQLIEVSGIGPKVLEQLRERVTV